MRINGQRLQANVDCPGCFAIVKPIIYDKSPQGLKLQCPCCDKIFPFVMGMAIR